MRRIMAAFALAFALIAPIMASPPAATADNSVQTQAADWQLYGTYPNWNACVSAAQNISGVIDDWSCEPAGGGSYHLWILVSTTPPPPANAIVGGSGLCLDVTGGNGSNRTPLQLWECGHNNAAQTWTIYSNGTVKALGKCMDARGDGTGNGTVIQIFDCNGGDNQKWEQVNVNGVNSFKNPKSGRCLDAKGGATTLGTPIQLYDCNGSPAQSWTVRAPF